MGEITLKIDNLRSGDLAPLYCRYDRQTEAQGAYIEIDEDGNVSADYNAEIGNAIPFSVFHDCTIRIGVSASAKGDALADILEAPETLEILERIHAGHDVEWDGSNNVGRRSEDCEAAIAELESLIEDVEQVEAYSASQWIENDFLADVWPVGKSLEDAAADCNHFAESDGYMIDGDMEEAILEMARSKYDYPSDAAKDGRWDIAQGMISRMGWGHYYNAKTESGDCEDLADAVETLWSSKMADLDGFAHDARRECVAEGKQQQEAEATLWELMRWTREDRKEGSIDLSWLPQDVRNELTRRRVDALNEWVEANPNPDDYRIYDYNSADYVSAEALGLDDEEYKALILDSLHSADNASGVVSTTNGRKVYAA